MLTRSHWKRLSRRRGGRRGGVVLRGRAGRGRVLAAAVILIALGVSVVWVAGRLHAAPAQPNVSRRAHHTFAKPHLVAHPQPVPILVYHHVLPSRKGPRLLYVGPAQFARELAYLKSRHYQAVTLRQVYDAWFGKGSLPRHPVVISFDDGYADQVNIAAPLLRGYHWPAEIDLILDGLYQSTPAPPNRVTPTMVRGLLAAGWEIESHTVTHRDLTSLPAAALRYELRHSRERLQQIFAVPVDFLCYPGGLNNARVRRAARKAGYLAATGTEFAAATPAHLYALPRIYCYWHESTGVFARRLQAILAAART